MAAAESAPMTTYACTIAALIVANVGVWIVPLTALLGWWRP